MRIFRTTRTLQRLDEMLTKAINGTFTEGHMMRQNCRGWSQSGNSILRCPVCRWNGQKQSGKIFSQ